jgi:hypothetical protein
MISTLPACAAAEEVDATIASSPGYNALTCGSERITRQFPDTFRTVNPIHSR